jgi:hypothetical protein
VTRRGALAAALLVTLVAAVAAVAAPTRSQTFFKERLLADDDVSKPIKKLLRTGGGFVDRSIVFRDLTRDGRDDAVVRAHTGGADGVVAVYVFTTDVRDADGELHVVYRAQQLRRASTSVVDRVLTYRTSQYAEGDEPCCPATLIETELRWVRGRKRFEVAEQREIPGPSVTPAPTPTPTP